MGLELIKKLISLGDSGQDTVLAVITKVIGSTPRSTGTKMIITADQNIHGTIGGGLGEEIIKRECLQAFTTKISFAHNINLTGDVAAGEGMICGGIMDVFVDYISKDDEYTRKVLTRYADAMQKNEKPVLVTITSITGEKQTLPGRKVIVMANGNLFGDLGSEDLNNLAVSAVVNTGKNVKPGLVTLPLGEKQHVQFFIDPGILDPEILILGGGHVALQLVKVASFLGFRIIVVDDRPDFANSNRFPEADKVICDNFAHALADLNIGPGTYTVIVTRGHEHDRDCLRMVIEKPATYIGMIGSRRKVKAIMNQLAEEGIPREKLKAVFSPIGLDIGAETPEEIAISIMAEVINVYRGGRTMKRGDF